jgi:DMSO/TMAO reductase YedYZ molybdopterin-dependent catalytic subunit
MGTHNTDVQVTKIDRRRFLVKIGLATATVTVVGAGLANILNIKTPARRQAPPADRSWSATHRLPNDNDGIEPVSGTRPELTPLDQHYRIDINSLPPFIIDVDWKLRVLGLVEHPLELRLDDLLTKYKPQHQFVTLSCISNPVGGELIGTQRWTGIPLKHILQEVRPKETALYMKISSADGFYESLSIEKAMSDERIMLAYAWDGLPLSEDHGFPLRLYVPDVYGMKQPKWIETIDVVDHYEEGYWVRRGWDEVAKVKATSVIDTVATEELVERDSSTFVPVGGIAYAGARGISHVEVKINDGPWENAQLRMPLSETTWVIWRYEWPFREGSHVIAVRCVDGRGQPQIEETRGSRPGGATGIYDTYFEL